MSHHSVVECYPLCSCSDFDCVALAAAIHFEQTSTVSPGIYTNTYQLSFYTDSDIMTALWTKRVSESHRGSKIPVSGSDLPSPCGCPSRPEGTAPCHVAPRKDDRSSPVIAPRSTPRVRRVPVSSTTTSAGHHYPLVPTIPRDRSSESPALGGHPITPTGNPGLIALTLWTLLGSIAVCPLAAASRFTLCPLLGLLPPSLAVMENRFALRNGYGTVEARYHLMAYDCSDPTKVQAYSSIPASPCPVRAIPVQHDRPTKFQLLRK